MISQNTSSVKLEPGENLGMQAKLVPLVYFRYTTWTNKFPYLAFPYEVFYVHFENTKFLFNFSKEQILLTFCYFAH